MRPSNVVANFLDGPTRKSYVTSFLTIRHATSALLIISPVVTSSNDLCSKFSRTQYGTIHHLTTRTSILAPGMGRLTLLYKTRCARSPTTIQRVNTHLTRSRQIITIANCQRKARVRALIFTSKSYASLTTPLHPNSFDNANSLFISMFANNLLHNQTPTRTTGRTISFLDRTVTIARNASPQSNMSFRGVVRSLL